MVAAGKVLLAGLNDDAVCARYPSGTIEAFTAHTIADVQALLKVLRQVRQEGYAFAIDESFVGLASVAAPICDYRGAVIAALSLSWPTGAISKRQVSKLTRQVIGTAHEISRRIGNALVPIKL